MCAEHETARAVPGRGVHGSGHAHGRRAEDGRYRADGSRRIEKAVLREAFAGYLPDSILWRQKEAVLRRCRLRLDRRAESARRGANQRPRAERGRAPLPAQPAADTRRRTTTATCSSNFFPKPRCGRNRAGWQVDCLLLTGGHSVGCEFRDHGRPLGSGCGGVHEQALAG